MNTSKDKYAKANLTMPEELRQRLDKYCNSVIRGKPRIRNLVIREAIEQFLNKHGGKLGDS